MYKLQECMWQNQPTKTPDLSSSLSQIKNGRSNYPIALEPVSLVLAIDGKMCKSNDLQSVLQGENVSSR